MRDLTSFLDTWSIHTVYVSQQVESLCTPSTPLTDREAVLLGDIIPTGLFAAEQGGVGPTSGTSLVAVVGCGPVGLMGVCAALHKGATWVLAIDMVRCACDMARGCAYHGNRLQSGGRWQSGLAPWRVRRNTPRKQWQLRQRGAVWTLPWRCAACCVWQHTASAQMVGSPLALQLAVRLCRAGGTVSSIGVYGEAETMPVRPVDLYNKNLTLRHGRCPARRLME